MALRTKQELRFNQAGFSMVEIITSVAIFAVISLVSINLFFSTTIGSTKDNTTRAVKLTGDHIVASLETSIRSARELIPNSDSPPQRCAQNMRSISLINVETGATEIWRVADNTLYLNDQPITPPDISVVDNRLYLDCRITPGSLVGFVNVRFTLEKGSPSTERRQEYVREVFEASINIRNRL